MNKDFYSEQISRLEKIFGRCPAPDEYFNSFHHFGPEDFKKAIDMVLEIHRPYSGHIFPSPSIILDALNDVMRDQSWTSPEDRVDADYCQRCNNIGMYLEESRLKFCDCIRGKKRKIVFRFWPDNKKIEEKQGRVTNAAPPYRGLKERNTFGFWEDTKEEHDRWMATKKAEIEEIDRRRVTQPPKSTLSDEFRKKLLQDTIADLRKLKLGKTNEPSERQPGEDEEEIIPF